jgi:hypothetical protein
MLDPRFVIVAALVNVAGCASYLLSTLKGRTKPNRVSFALWTLTPMVAFAAEIQQGVGLESLITFASGFGPLLILLASFKDRKSYWKLTAFDYSCGVLSLAGVILWAITREGNIAIFFSIIADFLAAMPTITKSYTNPETENWLGYLSTVISASIGLLTITDWHFANYGFPTYLLLMNLTFVYLIKFRPILSSS